MVTLREQEEEMQKRKLQYKALLAQLEEQYSREKRRLALAETYWKQKSHELNEFMGSLRGAAIERNLSNTSPHSNDDSREEEPLERNSHVSHSSQGGRSASSQSKQNKRKSGYPLFRETQAYGWKESAWCDKEPQG